MLRGKGSSSGSEKFKRFVQDTLRLFRSVDAAVAEKIAFWSGSVNTDRRDTKTVEL